MPKEQGNEGFGGFDNTLCWSCGRACGGCSWSREFKPVKGWEAVPTRIHDEVDSYHVIHCPKYLPEYAEVRDTSNWVDDAGVRLWKAVLHRAREDYIAGKDHVRVEVTRFVRNSFKHNPEKVLESLRQGRKEYLDYLAERDKKRKERRQKDAEREAEAAGTAAV